KLMRLMIAALVFPPRLVRAIRNDERQHRALVARSLEEARRLDPRHAKGGDAIGALLVYLIALPASLLAVFHIALYVVYGQLGLVVRDSAPWYGLSGTVSIIAAILSPFGFLAAAFAPVLVGFAIALGFNFMAFVSRVFRAELAALDRAGNPESTVLGRLRLRGV